MEPDDLEAARAMFIWLGIAGAVWLAVAFLAWMLL